MNIRMCKKLLEDLSSIEGKIQDFELLIQSQKLNVDTKKISYLALKSYLEKAEIN